MKEAKTIPMFMWEETKKVFSEYSVINEMCRTLSMPMSGEIFGYQLDERASGYLSLLFNNPLAMLFGAPKSTGVSSKNVGVLIKYLLTYMWNGDGKHCYNFGPSAMSHIKEFGRRQSFTREELRVINKIKVDTFFFEIERSSNPNFIENAKTANPGANIKWIDGGFVHLIRDEKGDVQFVEGGCILNFYEKQKSQFLYTTTSISDAHDLDTVRAIILATCIRIATDEPKVRIGSNTYYYEDK